MEFKVSLVGESDHRFAPAHDGIAGVVVKCATYIAKRLFPLMQGLHVETTLVMLLCNSIFLKCSVHTSRLRKVGGSAMLAVPLASLDQGTCKSARRLLLL